MYEISQRGGDGVWVLWTLLPEQKPVKQYTAWRWFPVATAKERATLVKTLKALKKLGAHGKWTGNKRVPSYLFYKTHTPTNYTGTGTGEPANG